MGVGSELQDASVYGVPICIIAFAINSLGRVHESQRITHLFLNISTHITLDRASHTAMRDFSGQGEYHSPMHAEREDGSIEE